MAKRLVGLDTKEIKDLLDALGDKSEGLPAARKLLNSLKTIKTSSAKAKGRKLQQDVCRMVSRITGVPYTQGEDGLIESRGMGQSGVDVSLRGVAKELFPYAVECKAQENLNLMESILQAKANCSEGYSSWLLIHDRKKLDEPVVVMPISEFERLMLLVAKKEMI